MANSLFASSQGRKTICSIQSCPWNNIQRGNSILVRACLCVFHGLLDCGIVIWSNYTVIVLLLPHAPSCQFSYVQNKGVGMVDVTFWPKAYLQQIHNGRNCLFALEICKTSLRANSTWGTWAQVMRWSQTNAGVAVLKTQVVLINISSNDYGGIIANQDQKSQKKKKSHICLQIVYWCWIETEMNKFHLFISISVNKWLLNNGN